MSQVNEDLLHTLTMIAEACEEAIADRGNGFDAVGADNFCAETAKRGRAAIARAEAATDRSPLQSVDTMPPDSDESTPFMVTVKDGQSYVTAQVRWLDGLMYQDCVEFNDHVPLNEILGWMPAPSLVDTGL